MKLPRACALLALSTLAQAQQPTSDEIKISLEAIAQFSDRVCGTAPTSGKHVSTDLSADGKLELDNLLKKLASAGARVEAKQRREEYSGFLQQDLAAAVRANSECRLQVFRTVFDRLLPPQGVGQTAPK